MFISRLYRSFSRYCICPNNKYRFKIEALSSTTDLCHMSSYCYWRLNMISYLSVNNFYVKPTLFLSSRHGCWALFSLAKTAASTLKFVLSCFVYLIMLYEELLLKRMISNNITIFVFFICCVVDNIFFVDLYHCLLIWTMLCAHLSQGRIQGGQRDIRPPDRFREGRSPTPEFGIWNLLFLFSE